MPDDVKRPGPSEEDVERVARALCDAEGFDPEQIGNSTKQPLWRNYLHLARTAINALKGERK